MSSKRFSFLIGGGVALAAALLLLTGLLVLLASPAAAAPAATADLFFSEYVEGSSSNKALEIYNGTGAEVDLADYAVELYSNGASGTPNFSLSLSEAMATLADGEVLVIANPSADQTVLDEADITDSVTFFNGNDAVVLKHNDVIIDVIGVVGVDSYWGSGDATTSNATLRRLPGVCAGDPDGFDDPNDLTNEWEGYPQDTFAGLGGHTAACGPGEVLLTEISVTPTDGEFLEIYNAGFETIDLGDYYLSDATFAGGNQYYYNIVSDGLPSGGGGFSDFHARFPDGATIDPGEYQIVALAGSAAFSATYSFLPTYELFEDGVSADSVPDMREATSGSIVDQGGLSNSGEVVVLYYWDGTTDLVTDMDYAVWGDKAEAVDKSGVSIDGPDAGITPTTYLSETAIADQAVLDTGGHAFGNTWQRRDLSEGLEAMVDGNGVNGEDETSENFDETWCEALPSPGAAANCAAPGSDLSIAKTGPEYLLDRSGEELVYAIVLQNDSLLTATNVVVTDTLPSGVTYVADSSGSTATDAGGGVYVWDLPDLPALSSTSFQVTATTAVAPAGGTVLTNTVEVTTDLLGDEPANNVAQAVSDVLPTVLIHEIQGNDSSSPLEGDRVYVEAIVVGDFQDNDGDLFDTDLDGFFIQEEEADQDQDPATSEGVFVYAPGAVDVEAGDVVCLAGDVSEYFGLTQLTLFGAVEVCGSMALPDPAELLLPVESFAEFERHEGMLVSFSQALDIAEYYNFDRYNEIVLAEPFADGRPFQPTAYISPTDTTAIADAQDLIERSRITLDDARSAQNPPLLRHPNGEVFTMTNRFRGGDQVQDATGILSYGFGIYRLQPTAGATYIVDNPRPETPPAVGGSIQVAAFNVLNYFLTLDDSGSICGPNQDLDCRGADDQEELDRQRAKILAALKEIDADVFGLTELENTTGVTPTADLVAGLNSALGAGTYAYVDTGTVGGDAIKVGLIYKPGSVTPLGNYQILDDPQFINPNDYTTPKNRAALAQTFRNNHSGGTFTVVVNHLKSKGSGCGAPDDDPVQGSCNETRAKAADFLVDWLATNPTGEGVGNYLIIGDLNAYDKEDPIMEIVEGPDDIMGTADDYADLLLQFQGEFAYSYVFDGQFGYLDYGLASGSLVSEVAGAAAWHINADEPDILDYDTTFKPDEGDALYAADPYRASDHDPVIIGLFGWRYYQPIIARYGTW